MASRKLTKPRRPTDNVQDTSPSPGEPSRKRPQAYTVASFGLDLMANISEASGVLSPLKAACKATKSILDVIQAVDDNQDGWVELTTRLEDYMSALENQIDSFEGYPPEDMAIDEALKRPLVRYVELLEDLQSTIANHAHKRSRSGLAALTEIRRIKIDAEKIRDFNRDIEDRHRQLMEALSLFTALRVRPIERTAKIIKSKVETILTDVDTSAILQLPMSTFVASSVHNPCLQGTRQAVLRTIWDWAGDDTSEKPIFWICDIAGSGKSTVAMSAVERWRTEGILGGQFFFSMANSEGATTEKFCSTIARDLVHQIPELAPHIAEAVKGNPAVLRTSFQDQFRTLITGPLSHRQGRTVLVIDAVDECRSAPQRKELLETLALATNYSKNLKIFITSRPDPVIEGILQPLSIKAVLRDRLHNVAHRDNADDIATYVHQSLHKVLSHDKRQRLIEKANGLFIWASTACRVLTSETNWSPPEVIYDFLISADQTGDIDSVYDLIFERTDPKYHIVMWKMLALLLAAFSPLTTDDVDDILKYLKISESAKGLVRNLGSVLTEDGMTGSIQFRHPTLVEYLRRCSTTSADSARHKMHLDVADAHGQLASWCLKHLRSRKDGLRFNICRIESSFDLNRQIPDLADRVSRFISERLRYGSSHWPFHLLEMHAKWRNPLKQEFESIIRTPQVLYWMEVLSVTGGVPRAIAGLRDITRRTDDSVPHIYISALPFAPTKSKLSTEGLKNYKNTLKVTQGLEETYHGLPRSLQGHKEDVSAIAFSPDGLRIASGSWDNTVRLWDAETGRQVGEPLRGHTDAVDAVSFSPSGLCIVSGSSDHTIRLWNAETGQPIGETLKGHKDAVVAVSFSPDGTRIVSGSSDKTIRLWDVETGKPTGEPLQGHNDGVYTVAFSPDGSTIVSGSGDNSIRLWGAQTGQTVRGDPVQDSQNGSPAAEFSLYDSQFVPKIFSAGIYDDTAPMSG